MRKKRKKIKGKDIDFYFKEENVRTKKKERKIKTENKQKKRFVG